MCDKEEEEEETRDCKNLILHLISEYLFLLRTVVVGSSLFSLLRLQYFFLLFRRLCSVVINN